MLTAHVALDRGRAIGAVNRRVFGSFVEHLGRSVYGGIYEPGHPSADGEGFRTDVIDLVRELGVSTIRYPGGNFVSGFRWEDSVGPQSERPRRLDLAWHSTETNEVGLHEFDSWLQKVGSELMLAVNLGTRGVEAALDLLEYTNVSSTTALTDQRARNGHSESFGVSMWCLGNEMDGPWQLGHSTSEDYGKLAAQTARAMRQVDPNLELVVCGSSSAHMPTFGEWERVVLPHTYEHVDYISCHAYYEELDGDTASFLASAVDMDQFIDSVVATVDHVKAVLGSSRTINISFDEWNVWYQKRYQQVDRIQDPQHWPEAPRLLEDVYSVLDAVVFGSLLISLINHADRVTAASLAQLVNVIAPIMTQVGGPAWRQTTFWPFAIMSRLARGEALAVALESPRHDTAKYGTVATVDCAATIEDGRLAVFLVNRSETEHVSVTIEVPREATGTFVASTLADADINATNTQDEPLRVTMHDNTTLSREGDRLTITPPVSWTAIEG